MNNFQEWTLVAILFIGDEDAKEIRNFFVSQRSMMYYHAHCLAIETLSQIDPESTIRNIDNNMGYKITAMGRQYDFVFTEVIIDGKTLSFDEALEKLEGFKPTRIDF
ncbi:hypothetical protein [Staphylococcus aureus]|uniref:hypothetical protein n=1 Tax=Staphylococcus aureus TaxID=1280 RepID=UPI0020BFF25E|nr:hypothetical protein [Staphylococcus aureus]